MSPGPLCVMSLALVPLGPVGVRLGGRPGDGSGMGVFLLFGSLTLVALIYFWFKVPETKGRSLQEIEEDLTGRAVG